MKLILKILAVIICLLVLSYLLGPRVKFEKVDPSPISLSQELTDIESYVNAKEAKISNIKPDNQSQFIWIDSLNKTEYVMIYLHGFSASHGECQPILSNLAERYNCNIYLPRLFKHGLDEVDAFVELTPKELLDSAKEAIAVAKKIGRKLIVVSTSTGCTLGSYLSAYDKDIVAHIMTSPNFDLHDQNSQLLLKPWGKQIFRQMIGGDYRQWDATEDINKYWTTKNRIEGHIALRSLLNQTMTKEVFSKIDIPVYVGYYYKNENEKDNIISVDAIHAFEKTIATAKDKTKFVPFSTARGHVISSMYMNQNWEEVQNSIFEFCENTLGLKVKLMEPTLEEAIN